jgi:hypothetical protein
MQKIKLFLNFFIRYIINEMSSLIYYHKLKKNFKKIEDFNLFLFCVFKKNKNFR